MPGDADQLGLRLLGAGFYVDATQAPWSQNYRMYSYVVRELPADRRRALARASPARPEFSAIPWAAMVRSTLALRNPHAVQVGVGVLADRGAHAMSLGQEGVRQLSGTGHRRPGASTTPRNWWRAGRFPGPSSSIRARADQYLAEQLLPEKFAAAAAKSGQRLTLRMQPGYDHGYYFIQTFMADHLRHHAEQLGDRGLTAAH